MKQDQIMKRPDTVSNAIILLYVSLILSLVICISQFIFKFPRSTQIVPPIVAVFTAVFTLGMMWFFIYNIEKGRNWARIIFLIIFIAGILFSVSSFLQMLKYNPIFILTGIIHTILQATALALLFQKSSSEWFKKINTK